MRSTRARVHAISTAAVAGIWAYHGLVPKLITDDADEYAATDRLGISREISRPLLRATGVAEIVFAALLVARNQKRWPWMVTAISMPVLAVGTVVPDPKTAGRAFNPITLNAAMTALALIGVATVEDRTRPD